MARNRPLTDDQPADVRARIIDRDRRSASHPAVHMLDGATLAHGLSCRPPVGLTFVTFENPPGIHTATDRGRAFTTGPEADWFNHVNINAHDHGGPLHSLGNPDAWVSDLRRTFHGRRP